jgi:hypothetical protein
LSRKLKWFLQEVDWPHVSRVGILYEDMADDLKVYGPFVKHFAYMLRVIDRTMESTERVKYVRKPIPIGRYTHGMSL